ncbi:MAG: helix-turn-helix transcriptional regulator [Clostridia bacterium]
MKVNCTLSTLMGRERFSIQDVHDRTNLSRTTISNLYNDRATRIDYITIEKLCELFNCNVSELLNFNKNYKENSNE